MRMSTRHEFDDPVPFKQLQAGDVFCYDCDNFAIKLAAYTTDIDDTLSNAFDIKSNKLIKLDDCADVQLLPKAEIIY